ncbi:hypothetical protein C9374_000931 [Naegleria lovaniensis]|uniref:Uncharacterized protein n=1 Tax=Naegleria lovaniensis TaxID=51637 RepID=A0AA88GTG0_NAELO|nr:uncharacterized protein C9374_000931 [Naegleria lovaniensis]KAG2388081.1 hypothetical protein C9374_000931 [Naegleria lovaniensis]
MVIQRSDSISSTTSSITTTTTATANSSNLSDPNATSNNNNNNSSTLVSSTSFSSNTLHYGDVISLAIFFNPFQEKTRPTTSQQHARTESITSITSDSSSPAATGVSSPLISPLPLSKNTTTSQQQQQTNQEASSIVGFMSVSGIPGHHRCGLSADESILKNFDSALFVICKGETYSAKKRYHKVLNYFASAEKANMSSSMNNLNEVSNSMLLKQSSLLQHKDSTRPMIQTVNSQQQLQVQPSVIAVNHIQSQLAELEEKMLREKQENEIERERSWGKPVLYGERIQLYHPKTGLFLNVLRSNADLEKSSLKLSLSEGDRMCHFQFVPHFKFRSEGEPIRLSDKVIIMNEKTKHNIHISQYKYTRPLIVKDFEKYEVNASPHPADNIWILRLYRSYLPMAHAFIKGGDVIRIIHRDLMGALYHPSFHQIGTSTDSFSSLHLNPKYALNSITTLFQIEALDNSRGGIMYSATPCRFKHIASGQYIAAREVEVHDDQHQVSSTNLSSVNGASSSANSGKGGKTNAWKNLRRRVKIRLKLVLTDHPRDESAVFYLYSEEVQHNEPILTQSLLRIKHAQSNTWLRANDVSKAVLNDIQTNLNSSPSTNSSSAIHKSSHLVELWFDVMQREKDVFSLEHVNNVLQRNDIEILLNSLKLVIYLCTDSVQEDPLKREGAPYTNIQNHFRELNFIDAIFNIINLLDPTSQSTITSPIMNSFIAFPSDSQYTSLSTIQRYQNNIIPMCYRAVKQLAKQNLLNCTHILDKYFTTMQDHLSRDIGGQEVSNALVEIINDNMEVLEQIPGEKIEHFFELIKTKQKKPLFVSFLSNLCRCGDRPVTKNQKHLVDLLSKIDCKNVFYLPDYDDTDRTIHVLKDSEDENSTHVPLDQLQNTDGMMYRILIEGLRLLSSLCVGRHAGGISYVSQLLPLDLVMAVVESEAYGIELRSAMCGILEHCYLDNTSNGEFPAINLSRPIDNKDNPGTKGGSNRLQTEFIDYRNRFKSIRLFLVEFFKNKQNSQLTPERTPLIYNLVKIGYKCFVYRIFNPYANDTDSLQLKAKIDSSTNKLVVEGQDEYLVSMREMEEFLSVLLTTLDSTNDIGNINTMFDDIEQNTFVIKIKKKILDIFLYAMDLRIDYRISLIITAYNARNVILITDQQLNDFISKTITSSVNFFQFDNTESSRNFAYPLLYLFKYQNKEIPEKALKILQRSYNQSKELKENLQKVSILISSKSRKAYNFIYTMFNRIQNLLSTSSFTGGDSSDDFVIFRDTITQLIRIMKENKGTKAAFRNLGGHDLLIKCLGTNYPVFVKTKLSICCIELLTEFVRGDKKNQEELFREFRFLLELLSPQVDTTELLTEIVRENDQILLNKIDPLLIKLYLEKIISVGAKSYHLNFLRILTCDSKGTSIPTNQNEIINNLKEDYRSLIVLYNEEDLMKERERMIMEKEYLKVGTDLNYHINLLYLLRDCTRDKVGLAEGSVQAILPFSEMLVHLTDCFLIPLVRDPLMKLLTELYFITEKESTQDLSDVNIWKLFKKINTELRSWLDNEGKMRYPKEFEEAHYAAYPPSQLHAISEESTDDSTFGSSRTSGSDHSIPTQTNESLDPNIQVKRSFYNQESPNEEVFVNDNYVYKVVLPFIESFFENVFNKNVNKMLLQKENNEEIKGIIYELLQNVTEIYLHSASHREDIKRCHMAIQKLMVTANIDTDGKFKNLTKLAVAKHSVTMVIKQQSNKSMKQRFAVKNIEEDFLLKYKIFMDELERKGFFAKRESNELPKFAQLLQLHSEYLPRLVNVLKTMIEFGVPRDMSETFIDSIATIASIVKEYNAKKDYNFSVIHNIPELVLKLICSSNIEFTKYGLQLGIETLMSGNIENQQMYNRLLKTGNYETFFQAIKNKIKQSILEEKEVRKRGVTGILDTELTSYAWEVLRFLQLLCEGHNLENQQMLQNQPFNRISIDLVSECIEYVIHLFKYLSSSNVDKVIQALNAVNEFVQGPCEQSIQTLSSSSGLYTVFNDILENDFIADKMTTAYDPVAPTALGASRSQSILQQRAVQLDRLNHITTRKEMKLLEAVIITLTSMLEGGNKHAQASELKYLNMEPLMDRMKECAEVCIPMSFIQSFILKRKEKEVKKLSSTIIEYFKQEQKNVDALLVQKLTKDYESLSDEKTEKYETLTDYISVKKSKIKDSCEEIGTAIYMLLKYLGVKLNDNLEDEESVRRTIIYNFYESLTGSIEIIRDSKIEVVHFKKPRMCNNLLETTKDEFVSSCNRETAQTKVADLYEWTYRVFKTEMHHLERYRSNENGYESRTWRFLERYWKYMKNLSFLFSLLINIIVLIFYHKRYDVFAGYVPVPGVAYSDSVANVVSQGFKWKAAGILVIVLGFIQLVTTILLIVTYLRFFLMLNVKKKFQLKKEETWESATQQPGFKKKLFLSIVTDLYLWWTIIFLGISLIGLIVTPLVYCLQLFEVITLSHVLQDIFFSIFENKKKFFLFSVLTIFALTAYAFTIFAFKWDQWIISNTNSCSNAILCFATTINYSVRSEAFLENIMDPKPLDVSRFFFDMAFYFVVVVILLEVLFGLILDSFSERRERRNKLEKEKKEICFICHNEKNRFDLHANEGLDFESHIKTEHNMWNYVYFLIYLSEKERDEYTGTEQYVEQNAAKLSFFPTLRSKTLELAESGALLKEATLSDAEDDTFDENALKVDENGMVAASSGKYSSTASTTDDFEAITSNKDCLLLYI